MNKLLELAKKGIASVASNLIAMWIFVMTKYVVQQAAFGLASMMGLI